MEAVRALLKGPPSYEPGPYIEWLYRLNHELSQSPHRHFAEIGRPLRQAADLLVKVNNASEQEQKEAFGTVVNWMLEAQGLALYAFLEEFRKAAEAVAEEAKKQKPGSRYKEQFDKLDAAYREVFRVLRETYNGALDGKTEAWESFPAAFAKAEQLVAALKPA